MESISASSISDISLYLEQCRTTLSAIFKQTSGLSEDFDKVGDEIDSAFRSSSDFDRQTVSDVLSNKAKKLFGIESVQNIDEFVNQLQSSAEKGKSNVATRLILKSAQWLKQYSDRSVLKACQQVQNRNQQVAKDNYETVMQMQEHLYHNLNDLSALYDVLNVEISLSDEKLEDKITFFQSVFQLWMWVSYMEKLTEFVMDTFNAWLGGKKEGVITRPNMYALICDWRVQSFGNEAQWDQDWKKLFLLKLSDHCRADKLLYLVDPYLFSRFVGCIWGHNSTLIKFHGIRIFTNNRYLKFEKRFPGLGFAELGEGSAKVLNLNSFYLECQHLGQQRPLIQFPKFGVYDVLGEALPPLLMLSIGFIAWYYLFSWDCLIALCILFVLFVLLEILWHNGCIPHTLRNRQKRYKKQLYLLEQEYEKIVRHYKVGVMR